MTEQKFLNRISVAYNYGLQQRGRRIEPISVILFWCGCDNVPKPFMQAIYAAYKAGRFLRLTHNPDGAPVSRWETRQKVLDIAWLDWLSLRWIKKEIAKKSCVYAGLSGNIPKKMREELEIKKDKAVYCVIKSV